MLNNRSSAKQQSQTLQRPSMKIFKEFSANFCNNFKAIMAKSPNLLANSYFVCKWCRTSTHSQQQQQQQQQSGYEKPSV
uniref:Uncharacterized protein n=1 Tax=Glossina palpalis gambiensis TaxID=67801 RepID=A0A1B0AV34_9MUSC